MSESLSIKTKIMQVNPIEFKSHQFQDIYIASRK